MNGDGGIYTQTLEPITVMIAATTLDRPEISRTVCDVIAGIISKYFLCPLALVNSSFLVW